MVPANAIITPGTGPAWLLKTGSINILPCPVLMSKLECPNQTTVGAGAVSVFRSVLTHGSACDGLIVLGWLRIKSQCLIVESERSARFSKLPFLKLGKVSNRASSSPLGFSPICLTKPQPAITTSNNRTIPAKLYFIPVNNAHASFLFHQR